MICTARRPGAPIPKEMRWRRAIPAYGWVSQFTWWWIVHIFSFCNPYGPDQGIDIEILESGLVSDIDGKILMRSLNPSSSHVPPVFIRFVPCAESEKGEPLSKAHPMMMPVKALHIHAERPWIHTMPAVNEKIPPAKLIWLMTAAKVVMVLNAQSSIIVQLCKFKFSPRLFTNAITTSVLARLLGLKGAVCYISLLQSLPHQS